MADAIIPSGARVPPHDLDAEAAVLSAIFMSDATFDIVQDGLHPEHFYADANRRVYEALSELRLTGQPVDIVLVANWLRDRGRLAQIGGTPYLAQLADATPAVANVEAHAAIITAKWRLRQLISIAIAAAAEAYAPVEDAQALCERVEQAVSDVTHLSGSIREEAARTIMGRVLERISHARARGQSITGIPTGFSAVDRMTGGLFDTDFTVTAARPGLGKTAWAQSIACNVARPRLRGTEIELGHAVLFCTLEQPREQLVMRLAGHEAEFDNRIWRRPRLREEDWLKISGAFAHIENLPIYIDDTPALTLGDLRAKVRRLKRHIDRGMAAGTLQVPSKRLGLVIVDYLQLMKGHREKNDTREREVSSLSQGLKNLAKQEQLPVLALAQLNRAIESQKDKRPQLNSLRESGAIEQDADNIWFLYRDSYYDRDTPNRLHAELDIAKQRNGPLGTVELIFRAEYTRYYSAAIDREIEEYDDFDAG